MTAGTVGRVLVLEVHAGRAHANQLGGEREGLPRSAEAGFHVDEDGRHFEQLRALGVEPGGVARALDALPEHERQLGHLVRVIHADVGVHVPRRGELPAAAVQRLEAELGHQGGGIGVVGAGGVEVAPLVAGLVQEAAQLGGGVLGLGWGEQLANLVGREMNLAGNWGLGIRGGRHRALRSGDIHVHLS